MAEQTIEATTESVLDNKEASVDNIDDEANKESKVKTKKKKSTRKKSSMMTREEQIESKCVT